MVEMAFVLPLLLLLIFGILEFGLVFARYQVILNSARNGARWASLARPTCLPDRVVTETKGVVIRNSHLLNINLTPGDITVTNACGTSWWNSNVEVRVDYEHVYQALGPVLGEVSLPIRVAVTMRNE